jgi:uncharacterized protein YecE (DUF72 family)
LPAALRRDSGQAEKEKEVVITIATAGWSIPHASAARFPGEGSHLQRYAQVMPGVEINSSFYREHAFATYARWASQTPSSFRFAVKIPKAITHEARLRRARRPLKIFLDGIAGLGHRLGPLLVQLPPSLVFERRVARNFFTMLRAQHTGQVVCEPRHPTWFTPAVDEFLQQHRIARVAADPAPVPGAAVPGGWPGMAYYRLHGSPRMYWSVYDARRLAGWAADLLALPRRTQIWSVFDNTAAGGATANALRMLGKTRG